MQEKLKGLRLPKEVRNIILFVSFFLIFDAVAIKLGAPYLQQNFAILSGKSEITMVSDLLFGEGAIVLGVGALLAAGASKTSMGRQYPGQYYKEKEMTTDYVKSRPSQMRIGVLLLIVGAILIGLSIAAIVLFEGV
jgi:hypothetical protein